MENINLTLIQTFFRVAQAGSFSAAARSMNTSYQSVANHVHKLEQVIGEKLVSTNNAGASLKLTSRGARLYQLLLPEIEPMMKRLGIILDKEKPIIRIGLPQAFFYFLLPQILKEFQRIHPQVEIMAFERDTLLPDLIADGSLDVCLSDRDFGDEVVEQHLMASSGLTLIYPSSWGAAPLPKDVPSWSQKRSLITFEPGHGLRNLILKFLNSGTIQTSISISTSGSSSVMRCVQEGLGFAILPHWCVTEINLGCATVDLSGQLPPVPLYFGSASYLSENPFVLTLRELCYKSIAKRISLDQRA
mgnify:CR=1 FL=1